MGKQLSSSEEPHYNELSGKREYWLNQVARREALLEAYEKYQPYIDIKKQSNALKGWSKKRFDSKHIPELSKYDIYKGQLKELLYPNEKITPQRWKSELKTYKGHLESTKEKFGTVTANLARIEVLLWNRKDLNRMLENERSKERSLSLGRSKDDLSL